MFLIITIACTALYLLATGLISSRLFHQDGPKSTTARYVAIVALLSHAAVLYHDVNVYSGQNLSIINVASIIAWIMAVVMTIASFGRTHVFLMPVVYGFTAIIVAMNALIPATHLMHIELQPSLLVHISLALFAYGSLMIALLYALQISYINYRLKHKKASILHSSLPPLMRVENTLFKILLVGTVLLSLSLLSGFVFLDDMFAQKQAHKTILSIVSWFIFSGIVVGHHQFGWRGRGVVIATIIGSFLLTLAYFGSRIVKEIILNTV